MKKKLFFFSQTLFFQSPCGYFLISHLCGYLFLYIYKGKCLIPLYLLGGSFVFFFFSSALFNWYSHIEGFKEGNFSFFFFSNFLRINIVFFTKL